MQPGPGGAQCALHAGIPANFVCARCGNFMCSTCAVNGSESQCPTCRQLNPIGFPYDANADMTTLWNHATSSFQRELAMCVVAGLIFFGFALGGGIIANIINTIVNAIVGIKVDQGNPLANLGAFGVSFVVGQVVGTLVNLVVQGVALVGLYRVLMDVLVGQKADLGRMFSQLHLLPQYIVMQLILFCVVTLPTLIYFGIVAVVSARLIGFDWSHPASFHADRLANPAMWMLVSGSFVMFFAAMIVILPITLFCVPELIVGQCGAVEAIKRAWQLGDGQRARVFGYSLVSGLVVMAGALLCGVGLLFALPVAYMLLLALFLSLRKSSSLPPAIHT